MDGARRCLAEARRLASRGDRRREVARGLVVRFVLWVISSAEWLQPAVFSDPALRSLALEARRDAVAALVLAESEAPPPAARALGAGEGHVPTRARRVLRAATLHASATSLAARRKAEVARRRAALAAGDGEAAARTSSGASGTDSSARLAATLVAPLLAALALALALVAALAAPLLAALAALVERVGLAPTPGASRLAALLGVPRLAALLAATPLAPLFAPRPANGQGNLPPAALPPRLPAVSRVILRVRGPDPSEAPARVLAACVELASEARGTVVQITPALLGRVQRALLAGARAGSAGNEVAALVENGDDEGEGEGARAAGGARGGRAPTADVGAPASALTPAVRRLAWAALREAVLNLAEGDRAAANPRPLPLPLVVVFPDAPATLCPSRDEWEAFRAEFLLADGEAVGRGEAGNGAGNGGGGPSVPRRLAARITSLLLVPLLVASAGGAAAPLAPRDGAPASDEPGTPHAIPRDAGAPPSGASAPPPDRLASAPIVLVAGMAIGEGGNGREGGGEGGGTGSQPAPPPVPSPPPSAGSRRPPPSAASEPPSDAELEAALEELAALLDGLGAELEIERVGVAGEDDLPSAGEGGARGSGRPLAAPGSGPDAPSPSAVLPLVFPTCVTLEPPREGGARAAREAARAETKRREERRQDNHARLQAAARGAGARVPGVDALAETLDALGGVLEKPVWDTVVAWALGLEAALGAGLDEVDGPLAVEAAGGAGREGRPLPALPHPRTPLSFARRGGPGGAGGPCAAAVSDRIPDAPTAAAHAADADVVDAADVAEADAVDVVEVDVADAAEADAVDDASSSTAAAAPPTPPTADAGASGGGTPAPPAPVLLTPASLQYGLSTTAASATVTGPPPPPTASNPHEAAILSRLIRPHELAVRFSDVGALKKAKRALREAVALPLLEPDLLLGRRAGSGAGGGRDGPEPGPPLALAPRGVLLYGPPGTGKTLLAQAAARDAGASLLALTPADLTSKWVGEGVRAVRAAFAVAAKASPCVLFLDEADALLGTRGSGSESEASRELKNELLAAWDGVRVSGGGDGGTGWGSPAKGDGEAAAGAAEAGGSASAPGGKPRLPEGSGAGGRGEGRGGSGRDGVAPGDADADGGEETPRGGAPPSSVFGAFATNRSAGPPGAAPGAPRVLVLAATNRPFDLDPAAVRRFTHRIAVPLPDKDARLKILEVLLRRETLASDVDLAAVAAKAEGRSGADLKQVAVEAAMVGVRETLRARRRARRAARASAGWGGGAAGLDDRESSEDEEDDDLDSSDGEGIPSEEGGRGSATRRTARNEPGAPARLAGSRAPGPVVGAPDVSGSPDIAGARDISSTPAVSSAPDVSGPPAVSRASSPSTAASSPRARPATGELAAAPAPQPGVVLGTVRSALAAFGSDPAAALRAAPRPISAKDFEVALAKVGPSVDPDASAVGQLEEWDTKLGTLGAKQEGAWGKRGRLSYYS